MTFLKQYIYIVYCALCIVRIVPTISRFFRTEKWPSKSTLDLYSASSFYWVRKHSYENFFYINYLCRLCFFKHFYENIFIEHENIL